MRKHFLHGYLVCALLLSAAVLSQPASAQEGCKYFNNIAHCPVGDAKLKLTNNGSQLAVYNLGSKGTDGVSSEFDVATQWRAKLTASGTPKSMTFSALLDGDLTSSASFEVGSKGFELRTTFTGSAGPHTYRAIVMDGNKVVGDFGGLNSSSSVIATPIPVFPPPTEFPWPFPWPPEPTFKRGPLGPCIWGFDLGGSFTVTTSAGDQAVGDSVRLVEDVAGGGHYPYAGFSAITMQANGASLVITDEEISK